MLTVQCRVGPALTEPAEGKLLEIEEPFERRVTTRLARVLVAVRMLRCKRPVWAPWTVSATLCRLA